LARAVYSAAVYPAGPLPITITFSMSPISSPILAPPASAGHFTL
jgi:hypothetical protein